MTRTEWSKQFNFCWECGWPRYNHDDGKFRLETHEIARGPARSKSLLKPAAWVRFCNACHADVGSVTHQLAIKCLHDPENYNREAVNLLRNRQPYAITEAEVDAEVENILHSPCGAWICMI